MTTLKRIPTVEANRILLDTLNADVCLYATYNGIQPTDWIEGFTSETGRFYARLFPILDTPKMVVWFRKRGGWFMVAGGLM